jgi:hypothetical protein
MAPKELCPTIILGFDLFRGRNPAMNFLNMERVKSPLSGSVVQGPCRS